MSRPLLLGHRGLRMAGEPPENSMEAFHRALELGCDGFEFDVRLTGDEQPILCHDAAYKNRNIAKSTCEQLAGLCTLEEVLSRFAWQAFLDIELKVTGLASLVLGALERHPPERGCVISSFLPTVLRDVYATSEDTPLGFLCDRQSSLVHWRELPVDYVIPHLSLVTRDLIQECHDAGKKVLIWTVNKAEDARRFLEWECDGMISDDPAMLLKLPS